MKANIILVALFAAAFMFPSIGSVDTADAQANAYSPPVTSSSPYATFDDNLMGAPGMSGAATTGSASIVCGGFNNKVMAEIHCLRVHLDTTAFRSNSRSSKGIGNYGCGNREDRHQQVHCLRNILDGNGLAPGTQP